MALDAQECLKELRLPAVRACYEEIAGQVRRSGFRHEQYLDALPAREREERRQNRIKWLLRASSRECSGFRQCRRRENPLALCPQPTDGLSGPAGGLQALRSAGAGALGRQEGAGTGPCPEAALQVRRDSHRRYRLRAAKS